MKFDEVNVRADGWSRVAGHSAAKVKGYLGWAYVAGRRPQNLRYMFQREIAGLCRAFQVDLPYSIEMTQRTG